MKIELSTLSPVTSSTIHQEITTLKRKRKEGSVLLFSISIIVLLPTVLPTLVTHLSISTMSHTPHIAFWFQVWAISPSSRDDREIDKKKKRIIFSNEIRRCQKMKWKSTEFPYYGLFIFYLRTLKYGNKKFLNTYFISHKMNSKISKLIT